MPSSSARAWGGKSGRSPLSSIARRAMLRKIERCCLSLACFIRSPTKSWTFFDFPTAFWKVRSFVCRNLPIRHTVNGFDTDCLPAEGFTLKEPFAPDLCLTVTYDQNGFSILNKPYHMIIVSIELVGFTLVLRVPVRIFMCCTEFRTYFALSDLPGLLCSPLPVAARRLVSGSTDWVQPSRQKWESSWRIRTNRFFLGSNRWFRISSFAPRPAATVRRALPLGVKNYISRSR